GDAVERIAHRVHESKGRDDRRRDRQRSDKGRPETPKEKEDNNGRKYRSKDKMLFKRGDGVLNKDRVVADDPHFVPFRKVCVYLGKALFDLACDGYGVLPGLF